MPKMAKSVDKYNDLEELGIDCDELDSLTNSFNKAADHLQTLLPNVDDQVLLTLYGYYKQATNGPCNTPKPSWYDFKAKSKWESWKILGEMPSKEAKRFYIDTIKQLDPTYSGLDSSKAQNENKETWVSVSTPIVEDSIAECNKTIQDYIKENNAEVVFDKLKTKGQDFIDSLDQEGLGFIHWAADRGYLDILKGLLALGANVNLQDSDGQTALHYAVSCSHVECIRFLLSSGASIDIVDNDGSDVLSLASDDAVRQILSSKS